ncbi:hypothetical protein R6Q59_019688 [Mikania micrantha]
MREKMKPETLICCDDTVTTSIDCGDARTVVLVVFDFGGGGGQWWWRCVVSGDDGWFMQTLEDLRSCWVRSATRRARTDDF